MGEALGEALVGEVVESNGELVCGWFSWGPALGWVVVLAVGAGAGVQRFCGLHVDGQG